MDQGVVTIKYSPVKWAQTICSEIKLDQGRTSNQNPNIVTGSPSKSSQGQIYTRRKYLRPLSSLSFQRKVEDSIHAMKNYAKTIELGKQSFDTIEQNWYGDLINVGQNLKLLRDAHKVVQTVRKKKALGLRVDFKPIFETKILRYGSPAHLDDEFLNANPKIDDDDEQDKVKEYPPPARRGRPRKKRGRERKAPVGRPPNSSRTRLARKQQECSPLPQPGTTRSGDLELEQSLKIDPTTSSLANPMSANKSEVNGPAFSSSPGLRYQSPHASEQIPVSTYQLSHVVPPVATNPEPQGPPLMYLPPILPSQRLQLVQGIPPYRHMREIEVGMTLSDSANNESANVANVTQGHINASMPKETGTNIETITPQGITRTDESVVGPEVSEISAVFRQLAEGQANFMPPDQERASNLSSDQVSLMSSSTRQTSVPSTYQAPYQRSLLNPSQTSNVSNLASTNTPNAPMDYELQRVEMELAAALEETAYPTKVGGSNLGDRSTPASDQSFINRLLN